MDLLEQLIFDGYATKDFEKSNGKIKFTLKTLNAQEQIELEASMSEVKKGTRNEVIHIYSLRLLTFALVRYQDKELADESKDEIYKKLEKLSTIVIDIMLDSNKDFTQECKDLVSGEELENLSQTPSTDSASN